MTIFLDISSQHGGRVFVSIPGFRIPFSEIFERRPGPASPILEIFLNVLVTDRSAIMTRDLDFDGFLDILVQHCHGSIMGSASAPISGSIAAHLWLTWRLRLSGFLVFEIRRLGRISVCPREIIYRTPLMFEVLEFWVIVIFAA